MQHFTILHLEDDPLDTELAMERLQEGGVPCHLMRVETAADFVAALQRQGVDLILADYSLPMFNGLAALELVRAQGMDIPFILLSGAVGEDIAIESLKSGATDYVLKQRLERLAPAVLRALREAEERRERRRAEEELRRNAERYRLAAEAVTGIIYEWNCETNEVYRSESLQQLLGYSPEEAEPTPNWWQDRIHPEDIPQTHKSQEAILAGAKQAETQYRIRHRDGHYIMVWDRARILRNDAGEVARVVGSSVDITAQKRAEEEIAGLNFRLRRAMTESHHRIKNNLQVLAALVETQRMYAGEMVSVTVLQRIGQHIRSLASLHDLLTTSTQNGDYLDTVPLKETLEKILALLQATAPHRRIEAEISPVSIPLKQGSSFAMLVTELISNAMKHGQGVIFVKLTTEGDEVKLFVCDEGPGWPPDFDPSTPSGVGMELVHSLVGWDLGGKMTCWNRDEGGACIEAVFPKDPFPVSEMSRLDGAEA